MSSISTGMDALGVRTTGTTNGTGGAQQRNIPVVEAPSDSEDEFPESSHISYALYPGAQELFPKRRGMVIGPPRLSDGAPSYITEDADGVVTVKLSWMDTDTRVRLSILMSMYADDATHFAKCTGFAAVVADLLKRSKESVATEFTADEIRSWDWTKPTMRVRQVDTDQCRAMKALHEALNADRVLQGEKHGVMVSKLKGWRHQLRLWSQGRQLYGDFQQIMPGKSFQEIEERMKNELGCLQSKPEVDERMRQLIEGFRKEPKEQQV